MLTDESVQKLCFGADELCSGLVMDIRELRMLTAIGEVGTLSGAARMLNMTQPALSAMLKRLEAELDVTLVNRHTLGVEFTEHGRFLLERAYNILHDMAETRTALSELAEEPGGEVAIGLPTTVARGLAPLVFKRVRARHPRIRLHVVEAMSGALAELLQLGRIDMAILFDIQPMAGLRTEPILIEDLHLMVAAGHAIARRSSVGFAELGAVELVLPSAANSIRRMIENAARAEGISLRVAADVDSLSCMIAMVEGGMASILPSYQLLPAIEAGTVRQVALTRPGLSWTLHLATRRSSVRPQASLAVADLVRDSAVDLVRQGVWPARLHPRAAR